MANDFDHVFCYISNGSELFQRRQIVSSLPVLIGRRNAGVFMRAMRPINGNVILFSRFLLATQLGNSVYDTVANFSSLYRYITKYFGKSLFRNYDV